jgi:two-component system response regulator MprA
VTVPVLMLTALDGVHNTVSGLHAGADDYLTKPFDGAELAARLGVLLRRAPTRSGAADSVVLDPAGHCVRHEGTTADLSPTEFRLLARLVGGAGEVVRRRALIAAGWPMGAQVSENTLDSYLRRIRDKLDHIGAGGRITTVRGVGYRWD